jgi:hypothetical protein
VVPTPADTSLVGGFFAAGESALTHIPWTFSSLLISSAGPPTVAPDQQTVDSIHENGNEWNNAAANEDISLPSFSAQKTVRNASARKFAEQGRMPGRVRKQVYATVAVLRRRRSCQRIVNTACPQMEKIHNSRYLQSSTFPAPLP